MRSELMAVEQFMAATNEILRTLDRTAKDNFQSMAEKYFNTFNSNIWEGSCGWQDINFGKGFLQNLKNSYSTVKKIILIKKDGVWSAIVNVNEATCELDPDDFHQLNILSCILLIAIEEEKYAKEN